MDRDTKKSKWKFYLEWMFATLLGSSIMGLVFAYDLNFENAWETLPSFFTGFVLGIPQWVVIRQYSSKAIYWLLISIAGWPIALFIGYIFSTFMLFFYCIYGFVILVGIIAAIIVGIVQASVFQQKKESSLDWNRFAMFAFSPFIGLIFGVFVLYHFYTSGAVNAWVWASVVFGMIYGAITGYAFQMEHSS